MNLTLHRTALLLAVASSALGLSSPATGQSPAGAPAKAAAPQAERPRASNKWRIVFDERAKSDGTISFRIWPKDGAPLQVDVAVIDGQSENHIAQSARDALRVALGKGFHVEVDDGEDVLVKARHGTGDFGLQLIGNTARDVDIKLRRE
ncbi:MAG: hypothetical protein ACREPC_08700 [Stenotrophomonas sp.]|uniref:hypothetical protein n=1 Tax=Stenotrophomonas sp. TaxID=69392 RepID=UPI003D6D0D9C